MLRPHVPLLLIAEDDRDDQLFIQRALVDCELAYKLKLQFVEDGRQAIDYIAGVGKFCDRILYPAPTMFITDLKMPYISGLEILVWLREHPEFWIAPVMIWSGSMEERDVRQAYLQGANAYLPKPDKSSEMTEILKKVFAFWQTCVLPRPWN